MPLTLLTALALALNLTGAAQSSGGARLSDNPRDLASLSLRWQAKIPVGDVLFRNKVLYIRGAGDVTAIDGDDGAVRWKTQCTDSSRVEYGDQGPVAVGDALAVSFGNRLFILEAATGQLRKSVTLGQYISRVLATPLLVLVSEDDRRTVLLRVEPESGEVKARREMGGMVYDLRLSDGVVLAARDASHGSSGDKLIEGIRASDLSDLWSVRRRSFPDFEEVDGRLHLQLLEGGSKYSRWRPIHPLTGELGTPLPMRANSKVSGGLSWELELTALQEGHRPAAVRRNSLLTGKPLWALALPGDPDAWLVVGDRLYLHCEHEGGRGYLLIVDWSEGRILNAAYGLSEIRGLLFLGDSLLAWTDEGVAAFSPTEFGPSTENYGNVREEVETILGRTPCDRDKVQSAVTDLKTLGPAALPVIGSRIPALSEPALAAASAVLADAGYRPAASMLAARLPNGDASTGCALDWGLNTTGVTVRLLQSLARLGGNDEVDRVTSIVRNTNRDEDTRLQAFATLASLSPSSALRVVSDLLSQRSPRSSWYSPPSPKDFAALRGRADLDAVRRSANQAIDIEAMRRASHASDSSRIRLPSGDSLLIFHEGYLGGQNDLWAAREDAEGRSVSPGDFLDAQVRGPVDASIVGEMLMVRAASGGPSTRIPLAEIGKDTDGDGLPDLVERRLATDPKQRDTDHDGLPDGEDPTPRGSRAPRNENDRIAIDILEQFFLFSQHQPAPVVIVHDAPLAWDEWRGATLTLTAKQTRQLEKRVGYDGILRVKVVPGLPKQCAYPAAFLRPLLPDERRYTLELVSGGLAGVGFEIVVRPIAGRWVITECLPVWLS